MHSTIYGLAKAFEEAAARAETLDKSLTEAPSVLTDVCTVSFEHVKRPVQEFVVIIEPALGAGGRKHVIKAETRAEAELKAKQLAKDMAEQERIIQFVE